MRRYRRKSTVVEARELTKDNTAQVAYWCDADTFTTYLQVTTPEGKKPATEGDFIVREEDGFRIYKPEEFERIYEDVND